jgi:hypothetical protein
MAYATDVFGTGLLTTGNTLSSLPSQSVAKAVNTATATPTDASRLGTVSPTPQPKPQTNTAQQALGAINNSVVEGMGITQKETPAPVVAPAPAPQPSALQKSLQDILGISTQLEDKGQRSFEIQEAEGVFTKQAQSKKIENEMLAKSRAYDKQIQESQKNMEGKLRSGVAVDIQGLEARKNSELADLAIQYKVANDDYAGAMAIASAKIDAEFAPLEARLETLKSYYQLAQNDMTESEKLQAETKIREEQARIEFGEAFGKIF